MIVTDPVKAAAALERIGYYRLSGYWYPFRTMRAGTGRDAAQRDPRRVQARHEFRHVVDLYVFDKRLRLLFLDAIERIEVGLRVDIALLLGARDPCVHRVRPTSTRAAS